MGIRDTSYYGWRNVYDEGPDSAVHVTRRQHNSVAIDSNDNIYVVGQELVAGESSNWIVRKSTTGLPGSFEYIDSVNRDDGADQAYGIAIDSNDNIYVVGYEFVTGESSNWIVRKSTTGLPGSFEYIDSVNRDDSVDIAHDVAIDSNDNVYVVGYEGVTGESSNWIVRKSTTGLSGSFEYIDSVNRVDGTDQAYGIAIDSNDNIYVVGHEFVTGESFNWIVRRSTTGLSGSFGYVDSVNRDGGVDIAHDVAIDSNDNIYVVGREFVIGEDDNWIVRKSTTGLSGSFGYVDSVNRDDGSDQAYGVATDSNDNVYVVGHEFVTGESSNWIVRKSTTGLSGSFEYVDGINRVNGVDIARDIAIDPYDNIYVVGYQNAKFGIVRKGKLSANSASFGPKVLAPSIGYVHEEFSGTTYEKFKLMNVAEFPHSQGIFQMKNIVLGTTDSGKVGKTEDNIIQIKYFGSVVEIMWPKQGNQTIPVKGFGDFSAGQRPGKLTNEFDFGDPIDVTKHDHLALYCYLTKEASGTLDNIEIRVERKPLKSSGFAVEQAIEYQSSGSVTIAKLTDLHFKKEINYGDLSIKEIGYPIDVPLTNVKEIRIAAKHTVGQSIDSNKNFVVWGRLISSESET